MKRCLLSIVTFVQAALLTAQPFRGNPTPNDTLHPVRMNMDHSVVLQVYAPQAKTVTVIGDFLKTYQPLSLIKADNGVWSVKTEPLQPDLYTYDYSIDGIKTFDPKNPQYKEGENGLSNVFFMPGAESDYCAIKDVAHGKLESV